MNWAERVRTGWFFSPQLEPWQKQILAELRARAPRVKGLVWVLSSGTQSLKTVKAIGLAEESILLAAENANRHVMASAKDRWLLAIPDYHIGGLSIYARAHLSGAKVFRLEGKWSAHAFRAAVEREKITLTSLVPAQVHDLVTAGLRAPKSLRAIIIGGGALEPWLYLQARAFGWPLLPSYGLTECGSQVATASLASLERHEFPPFALLPHVKIELREQRVFLKSKALCRWIACAREGEFTLESPLRDGWLPTEDLAAWEGQALRILGRQDSVVKVLGVLVPVQDVEFELGEFFRARDWSESFFVLPRPDARRGSQLWLVTDSPASLKQWDSHLRAYNASVNGTRRLAGPVWIERIPRTDLGKIKRAEISTTLF